MDLPLTYSRRKRIRDQEGKTPDIRSFPVGPKLLQQLFGLFQKINAELDGYGEPLFRALVGHFRDELGRPMLCRADTITEEFYYWWTSEHQVNGPEHDYRLDAIEIACTFPFRYIRENAATEPQLQYRPATNVAGMIKLINARMEEDCFGYRFEKGQVVEVASEYLHQNAIQPVLGLTSHKAFAAVDQEFRDALAELRAGNFDDCIADCGNALESTLKVIAAKKQWSVKPSDRAATLINMAFDNGLVPMHLQSQFTGLRSVVQGIPTLRNNEGGHGAGTAPRVVEKHFAEYMVQQTAAAILFLVKCVA